MPATKRSHRSQLSKEQAKKQAKNLTTGRFMSDEQRRKFEEEEEEENQLINQAILQAVEERVILDVSNASTNSSSNLAPCTSKVKTEFDIKLAAKSKQRYQDHIAQINA